MRSAFSFSINVFNSSALRVVCWTDNLICFCYQQENLLKKLQFYVLIMIGKLQGGYKLMSFSEEIRLTRQKSFMTQDEFAKEISVSTATINRWETGKARPNITAIKRIKTFCNTNDLPFERLESEWLKGV